MDSNTKLTSKTYKTIGELLKSPIRSIIIVSSKEKNKDVRLYLYEWLFKNYYNKKEMYGNLTNRIKNIANNPCYHYITKYCFENIDILNHNKTIINILNVDCINFISSLHSIQASLIGTYLDYLLRRIICELIKNYLNVNNDYINTNMCDYSCYTYGNDITDTNLFFISNYCYTEIDKVNNDKYSSILLPRIINGFITWQNSGCGGIYPIEKINIITKKNIVKI
jgi:hypothetical protein